MGWGGRFKGLTSEARTSRLRAFISLLLLGRTIGNLEGALSELSFKRIVEARTLVRCRIENYFWATALAKSPETFVQKIISDDAKSRLKRGKRIAGWSAAQQKRHIREKDLRKFLEEFAKENPKTQLINFAAIAEGAGIGHDGYIMYLEL